MERTLGLTITIEADRNDRRIQAELDFPVDRLNDQAYMTEMLADVVTSMQEQARLQGELQARGLRVGGTLQTNHNERPSYITPKQAKVRKKMSKRRKKKTKSVEAAMFGG